jgi:hypothetical protein
VGLEGHFGFSCRRKNLPGHLKANKNFLYTNKKRKWCVNESSFSRTVQIKKLPLLGKNSEFGGIVNYGVRLPEWSHKKRKGLAANVFPRAVPADYLIK